MQNNADLTSMEVVNQNLSRQIRMQMAELRALLDSVTSSRLEFHEILVAARAVGNKFGRLINSVRQMETDLLQKEYLLLGAAEWLQTKNITINQTEPKTTEQIMELMFVTDLMEVVDSKWDALQESKGSYNCLSRHLDGISQWILRGGVSWIPHDASQDRQSMDGAARDAQTSNGIMEDMEDDSEDDSEDEPEDESEDESEEETDEEME